MASEETEVKQAMGTETHDENQLRNAGPKGAEVCTAHGNETSMIMTASLLWQQRNSSYSFLSR